MIEITNYNDEIFEVRDKGKIEAGANVPLCTEGALLWWELHLTYNVAAVEFPRPVKLSFQEIVHSICAATSKIERSKTLMDSNDHQEENNQYALLPVIIWIFQLSLRSINKLSSLFQNCLNLCLFITNSIWNDFGPQDMNL